MIYPFVALEGIDGVGKTTAAKLLAEQMGAKYFTTPAEPLNKIRMGIEEMNDVIVRFHYYLCAVICATPLIRNVLEGSPLVCDRYIASTIAYHKAMGVKMDHLDLKNLPIVTPSHTFLLVADEEVRRERIAKRKVPSAHDHVLETDQLLLKRAEREFRNLVINVIDTSTSEPNEVVIEILKQVTQGD